MAAFISAVIHGATGMAGGIILAAIASHVLGIKQAIPLVTVALLLSHSSRAYFNRQYIAWDLVRLVMLSSAPFIVLGAITFVYLPATLVALVMALVLLLSFPIKRYAKKHQLRPSTRVLSIASSAWGYLAGNVIGPGFILAPFLLGTGIGRVSFVASLAVIALVLNFIKVVVFGLNDIIDQELLMLGIAVGIITVPGNWLGKKMLHFISDDTHNNIINCMTVGVILNFLYLASQNTV